MESVAERMSKADAVVRNLIRSACVTRQTFNENQTFEAVSTVVALEGDTLAIADIAAAAISLLAELVHGE